MIKQHILGGIDPGFFFACVFFAFIGVLIVLLAGTKLRDPKSISSPIRFSWSYLFSDNAYRIYANILAVLATIRFMPDITGKQLSIFASFCTGMAWDIILLLVKQKTSWLDTKPK